MSSGMNPRSDGKRAAPATALAQDLGAVIGKLKRRLREQAHVGDLTPSQTSALLRLEKDGPATASNLARAEGMRPQSMGAVVAALEAAGMVRGAPDPNDGRQIILSLTDAFRKRIREGRAARQDWLSSAIQARLSPREQDEVAAAVALLKRLVDD
jgi:DNA-binding MarR family transcriptional regulator